MCPLLKALEQSLEVWELRVLDGCLIDDLPYLLFLMLVDRPELYMLTS